MSKIIGIKKIDEALSHIDVAFRMVGISAPKRSIETIIAIIEKYQEQGGMVNLRDICKIEAAISDKYDTKPTQPEPNDIHDLTSAD